MESEKSDDHPRESNGRFRSGGPGRPKGAKNKRVAVKPAAVERMVHLKLEDRLQQLLGKAWSTVEQRIEAGDPRASIWAIERAQPREHQRLSSAIDGVDLTDLDGIVETGRRVVEMVAGQQLSLNEGSRFLAILSNYGQLRGLKEMSELGEKLAQLQRAPSRSSDPLDPECTPAWLKLKRDGPAGSL